MNLFPSRQREQGMPGACCTHGLACNGVRGYAHEHTGTVGALRHSLRNGLTAYAELSLETNSFCLHRCRLDGGSIRLDQIRHRQLDISHGCQNHTVLPYAATSVILRAVSAHGITALRTRFAPDAACVHRIPPRVRDDARSAPLVETGRREITADLGLMERGIFLREGLDRFLVICPSG